MALARQLLFIGFLLVILTFVVFRGKEHRYNLYSASPGEPLPGLTGHELEIFRKGKVLFEHDFVPEEGLGPVFNGRSCFECHGKPVAVGLEGQDLTKTGVVRIGAISPATPLSSNLSKAKQLVDSFSFSGLITKGGPSLERRSVTLEFPSRYPSGCVVEVGVVPLGAQFISLRHAGPLLGLGLIEAIDDETIMRNMMRQAKHTPELVGRTNPAADPLTLTTNVGRFGWKAQNSNLLLATAEVLNNEIGITTFIQNTPRSGSGIVDFPECIAFYLPPEPNDEGKKLVLLTAFQALLAPPAPLTLTKEGSRGKAIFKQLQCAVCHTPELPTAAVVYIPNPGSPFPALHYMEVKALESQPVRLYSDLLLHDMGAKLADGIVQSTARGGEWRTTPLWGIRFKKFFLHNGSAKTVEQAILAHGGQALNVKTAYESLPHKDKKAVLEFLSSL